MHRLSCLIISLSASALLLWQTYNLLEQDKRILMHDMVSRILSSSPSKTDFWKHETDDPSKLKKRYGYFLQITDIHIDDHYTEGATLKSGCHTLPDKQRLQSKHQLCSIMGEPGKRMDAPPILIEHTFDWIRREWKDKLDFVVWTGDNARHDWDEHHPRRKRKVLELNRRVADMMSQLFNQSSIPIVPVIGNNDVQPHNYIKKNDDILGYFETMWDSWIPSDQRQDFLKGGYFAVDVVPSKIRVLSMNTMFFMRKNPIAKTCSRKHSVGYTHMRWFEQQLLNAREQGIKVFVIGHVPPSTRDFFRGCLRSYLSITSEFSDVVMGHFYGHLNMDHFLLYDYRQQEEEDVHSNEHDVEDDGSSISYVEDTPANDIITIQRSKRDYVKWLKKMYKKVVRYEKEHTHDNQYDDELDQSHTYDNLLQTPMHADRTNVLPSTSSNEPIVVIHIAPSVFPIYMSSLRIYRYEIDDTSNQSTANYGRLLGYSQFVANITRYNHNEEKRNHTDSLEPLQFDMEYDTEELYGLKDLSPQSYLELARNLTKEEDMVKGKEENSLWKKFCQNMFLQTISNICY